MSLRLVSSSSLEDVLKETSRRLDEDEYIRLRHMSSEDFFKMSLRRLDLDEYTPLAHTFS